MSMASSMEVTGRFLRRLGMSILKGDFMKVIKVTKYFIHILYTFLLFFITIWLSLAIEKTFSKVEVSNDRLEDLRIYHAQKTVEMVSLGRMSTIQKLLEEKGSEVTVPQKPATIIQRRRNGTD